MMNCGGACQGHVNSNVPADVLEKTKMHPCYSADAHHKFARMHLPVAPRCNIGCNYCNRKYDCVNESRPGVTSEILSPEAARNKFDVVREKVENLSVVGIAGPGDSLADWENTREAIRLIKEEAPETIFCLSTNGLLLPEYAADIISLGVNHVTVTLNTIDPKIGSRIYRFVTLKGHKYEGEEGAAILLERQLEGIRLLTAAGVLVKINIVMIKGINDQHIPEVVKKVRELGVFITNIMPLIPAPGSRFENFPQTSTKELNQIRDLCQIDMPQMRHCKQCRADAIGLLGEDRSLEFSGAGKAGLKTAEPVPVKKKLFRVAVASKHGVLIDQHFGHAEEFAIYMGDGTHFELVERRQVEKYCNGVEDCGDGEARRENIISALKDCDAVLSMRIGYHAKKKLEQKGIVSIESCDTIKNELAGIGKALVKSEIA